MSTADHQSAQPDRAWELTMREGKLWRIGRSIQRTIYVQIGEEASKEDLLVGIMDSPELATLVVNAVNGKREH